MHRFLVLALCLSGCALSSVRETAALGEQVARSAPVLLASPRACALLLAAGPGGSKLCAELKVEDNARIMHQSARLLGAYSGALRDLATQKDISLSSLTELLGNTRATAEATPPSVSVDAAGRKLSGIMTLITADFRRKELAHYITMAAPHVKVVTDGLLLHVRLSREVMRSLLGGPDERGLLATRKLNLADAAGHLGCGERDATCKTLKHFLPLHGLALLSHEFSLRDQDEALARYEWTLRSFAVAHEILARHAGRNGLRQDRDTYAEIKEALRRAAGGK